MGTDRGRPGQFGPASRRGRGAPESRVDQRGCCHTPRPEEPPTPKPQPRQPPRRASERLALTSLSGQRIQQPAAGPEIVQPAREADRAVAAQVPLEALSGIPDRADNVVLPAPHRPERTAEAGRDPASEPAGRGEALGGTANQKALAAVVRDLDAEGRAPSAVSRCSAGVALAREDVDLAALQHGEAVLRRGHGEARP